MKKHKRLIIILSIVAVVIAAIVVGLIILRSNFMKAPVYSVQQLFAGGYDTNTIDGTVYKSDSVNYYLDADKKVKEVFDLLTRKAHERGIKLMLMIPVDKYDLYQDYITDNPYPPKRVNEDVRDIFGDIPEVMLCKYCLLPLLKKGEKDVFMFDNTHWSYKGSEAVGKELSRRVNLLLRQ